MAAASFSDILARLESHGWALVKIDKPYRVFTKRGHLPILIPVDDRQVADAYVKKVEEILDREGDD